MQRNSSNTAPAELSGEASARSAAPRTGPQRVVICGGGAGGLVLAIMLARRSRGGRDLAVTLADPSPTHVWKPLLHEFASGSADPGAHETAYFALARWHGFTFAQGPLEGIDRDRQDVLIGPARDETGAELAPARRLPYDRLVIAVGGVTNDFGVMGVKDHAFALDSAADAERLHRRIVQACMRANYGVGDLPDQHLDICIVGGGATGVELAAELRATTRELIAYGLDRLDPGSFIRIGLINADPRLLLQLPERIAESVEKVLRELNIDVRNGQQVTEVAPDHVVMRSGEQRQADITIWAAGVKAPAFLAGLGGLATNRMDQIEVTPTLLAMDDPHIFAMGDCASAPWLDRNVRVPPRAQAAYQEARYLARAIPAALRGEALKPFRYNDLGSLVSLGGESAVGTLMGWARGAGIRIEGLLAQLIYRWLYKQHQAALFGWWAVFLESIGGWFRGATRPHVKLH
jgi:NADH dehydrogenase